jgi:hypothetical protein
MAHWRQVLALPVLEVEYEETVRDLEGVARRLVAWCGLDWEPACLNFHEARQPVRTASVAQVRQPIYHRSVGRWKHYEKRLGPLFAQLPQVTEPGNSYFRDPVAAGGAAAAATGTTRTRAVLLPGPAW